MKKDMRNEKMLVITSVSYSGKIPMRLRHFHLYSARHMHVFVLLGTCKLGRPSSSPQSGGKAPEAVCLLTKTPLKLKQFSYKIAFAQRYPQANTKT